MYAVVRIAGKQFRVEPQDRLKVPRLESEAGSQVTFDDVLAVAGEGTLRFGAAASGTRVVADVLQHDQERTILIYHKKRRKDYRKKNGHRQPFTEIRIAAIQGS